MKSLSVLFTIFSVAWGTGVIPPPGPDGKYTLAAGGIRAQFIPHAAAITNLFVKDKNGVERDIVIGFDNASDYPASASGHYGAVPGRYTNRIGNAQYTMDGVTYRLEKNDGNNTLHSGPNGWGFRTFNVVALCGNSITFSIHDPNNSSIGMPGAVNGHITYTLSPKTWNVKMTATAPEHKTPLMLTQHTYWNLDAFSNPDTDLIFNHSYHMPFSQRLLEPDPNMLPTGNIVNIPEGDINDFWSKPKLIGADRNNPLWKGNCGTGSGCGGYSNCWVVDKPKSKVTKPVATLSSEWSGIKVDIYTDEVGMQVFSCYWSGGDMPIKKTQGGPGAATNGFMQSSGCIALEAQDWVDGINHPEWGRKQFYGPGERYKWETTYKFSTL
ncbi:galactose mutarotase-like protein [Choiromyces venosus 120613-1]|uniref:Galactose mutarotase-like protein n=1 Tax=Choiromyces venosus 120613-1 TaxID=1336337 RepID=A0A3N4J170_9PEZI|nr:galactose mutarotase-like protein [Choiromyces venosus 120613-1]